MEKQIVVLHKIKEFEQILAHYKVSDHAKEILSKTKLVILVGLAGGGRNTIINKLLEKGSYHSIISDTTRPPKFRDGAMERDGVQYFFRSEDEILKDLKDGEFLEAEIIHSQQVSGTSIRELEKAFKEGKVAINEVELGGSFNIVQAKPDTTAIFIVPPNFEEWQRRLRDREEMSEQEFGNRMETARRNLDVGLTNAHFYFVVNDNLDESVELVDKIAKTENYNREQELAARDKARAILSQLESLLTK